MQRTAADLSPLDHADPDTRKPGAYVQVPTAILTRPDLNADEVAAWAVLQRRVRPDQRSAKLTREQLAAELGWASASADRVSRLTARMHSHGLLLVEHRRQHQRTLNSYAPLHAPQVGDGTRYAELPHDALEALRAGRIGTAELRSLGVLLHACGRRGWTSDALTALAAGRGVAVRTLRRHRQALVAAGLLDLLEHPGQVTVTARPGADPAEPRQPVRLRSVPPRDPPTPDTNGGTTPDMNGGTTPDTRGGTEVLPRTPYLPTADLPGPARRAAAVSRRAPAITPPAGSTKIRARRRRQRLLPATASALAVRTGWLEHAPPWTRAAAARLIDQTLAAASARQQPIDPRAVSRYLADLGGHDEPAGDAHLPAVRDKLRQLLVDVRAGTACPGCGQDTGDRLPLEACDRCHPDSDDVDPHALALVLDDLRQPPPGPPPPPDTPPALLVEHRRAEPTPTATTNATRRPVRAAIALPRTPAGDRLRQRLQQQQAAANQAPGNGQGAATRHPEHGPGTDPAAPGSETE